MPEKTYKKILVAIELIPKSDAKLLDIAKKIAKINKAQIFLVHAIEYIASYSSITYGGVASIEPEIEEMLFKQASKNLEKVGKKYGIPIKNQIVDMGSAKFVLLDKTKELKADLIVIGSHGREGFRMILGSTANAVLHGANCDVLAIRIHKR